MRVFTKRRTVQFVAVAGALALALTGCSEAPESGPSDNNTGNQQEVKASPGITDSTITFGITSPLSGNAAGVGNCAVDGAVAYFEAKNAEGGFEFGDGKTRKVEVKAYDDGYDPQKSAANFQQMVADGVFGGVLSLGTPTNRSWREAAAEEHFPQALVQTGDPIFSDREQSPWSLGLLPVYPQEGAAFGEMLVKSGTPHKVAILYQNDDFGAGYVEGFKNAVKDAPSIQIVKEASFEATATEVNAQITDLASTGADVFFNAMSSLAPLVMGSLTQAATVKWHPSIFFPSVAASPSLLEPSGVTGTFDGIYTAATSQSIGSPAVQQSPDGKKFLEALDKYTSQDGVPAFPQCLWSWMGASILEAAFADMKEPTRDDFMRALRSISGLEVPFLLEGGTIDTTQDKLPAMGGLVVQKYNGVGYDTVKSLG